jgi:histidine triad (HIT) family protein
MRFRSKKWEIKRRRKKYGETISKRPLWMTLLERRLKNDSTRAGKYRSATVAIGNVFYRPGGFIPAAKEEDMDCIFCKIVSKEAPSEIVHESERTIVIRDIKPQAPTHLLIIPKSHYATLMDCNDTALFGELMTVAKDAAEKIGASRKGFRLVVNTGREGGQLVMHLHMHLLSGRALREEMG